MTNQVLLPKGALGSHETLGELSWIRRVGIFSGGSCKGCCGVPIRDPLKGSFNGLLKGYWKDWLL